MITGCYLPTWCKLELDDGRTVNALVFIMDPRHPLFEPDTSAQVIAPLIARASGPLGTNAQYLFSLEQALRKLGMHDASLDDLVASVRRAVGRESDAGPGLSAAQKKTPGMTGRPIADQ
ncbi:Cation transport protein chaC [Klebsiella pneumoniae]|uniref:glutathione-specific gamma-glutamylcyclotransferase n=1 Tax=Klebsiella pneumoniae TaxID=573 RepID=A0A377V3M2_KLEPN|nr:Cation transport protein chaC [Klebsiella pneumoniae]